jgi:hypothetical protein
MRNKNCGQQENKPFDVVTANEVRPNPKCDIQIGEKTSPLKRSKSSFRSIVCLHLFEFLFGLSAMFLTGLIFAAVCWLTPYCGAFDILKCMQFLVVS